MWPDDDPEPYDETGTWPQAECATCGDIETRLRCSGCGLPVCHHCEDCANQCTELGPLRWRTVGPPVIERVVVLVDGDTHGESGVRPIRCEAVAPTNRVSVKKENGKWIHGVIIDVDADDVVFVQYP